MVLKISELHVTCREKNRVAESKDTNMTSGRNIVQFLLSTLALKSFFLHTMAKAIRLRDRQ